MSLTPYFEVDCHSNIDYPHPRVAQPQSYGCSSLLDSKYAQRSRTNVALIFDFDLSCLFCFGLLLLIQLNMSPCCFYVLDCLQIGTSRERWDNRGDQSILERYFEFVYILKLQRPYWALVCSRIDYVDYFDFNNQLYDYFDFGLDVWV